MVSTTRVGALLGPRGFAMARDVGDSEILYSRPAEAAELWEHVLVSVGGKCGEAVGAGVSVSVRYGFLGGRGLFVAQSVPETGNGGGLPPLPPPTRRLLRDHEDVLLWERLVADICPDRARDLARRVGPALLARTADARDAVRRYLDAFGTRDWRQLRDVFELRATRSEISEAERIATSPPMIQVFNGREFYVTIILGIILHSDRVEGRQIVQFGAPVWPEFDPHAKTPPDWSKWGLLWRIEILADRMLARYPEPMPTRLSDG